MKKQATSNATLSFSILAATALALTMSSAETLASWDSWGGADGSTAPVPADSFSLVSTAPLVTEPATDGALRDVRTDRGSNDGTFGTLAGAIATADGALRIEKQTTTITERELWIQINNDSGESLLFDELHFDAIYANDSFQDWSVTFVNETLDTASDVLASGTLELGETTSGLH